ncbi:hypothetical protein [Clostridium sardiniense]|uniref:hypothetical protein n=1 Tax=Clostridium sardiniense TaxID=29369 RepID=UPI00195D5327|nr:hypothetical protein [Clostridium sardiniense]MBM7835636.1 hypothetical protein [Clostridium sardiniense]
MKQTIYKPKHIDKNFLFGMLVKVCKKQEHLEDFINGKLFMNTNFKFSQIEQQEELSEGQYDSYEGTQVVLNPTDNIETVIDYSDGEPKIYQGKRGEFEHKGIPVWNVQLGRGKNIENVFCMYSIWVDLENNLVTKIDDRMISEFGDYCAIVLNKEEFINRVERAVNKLEYNITKELRYGYVEYVEINGAYVELGTFRKRKKYKYQSEFRIALGVDREPRPLVLDVGNLADIVAFGRTDIILQTRVEDKSIVMGKT